MKLIIDIPEEDYIRLRDEGMFGNVTTFKRAVREGIPLAEQEPCTDCIRREDALMALTGEYTDSIGEILPKAIKRINALPPVTPQYTEAEIQKMQDLEFAEIQKAYEIGKAENPNKWIPVSERLPEDKTAVLVWCPQYKNIYCAYLEKEQWWIFGAFVQIVPNEVVAWMPLPEPYNASPTGAERSDKK
jgi:hypothetical protein